MALPFATNDPTQQDTLRLSLMLSTYLDGTGNQRDKDGGTRANWREIERCVAESFMSATGEDKGIFDVVAADREDASLCYGFSVKSKEYARGTLDTLDATGRVYMEVANSPAKFWAPLHAMNLDENDFRDGRNAAKFGASVIKTVQTWHKDGKILFERDFPDKKLDLDCSCYLSVTYSKTDSWRDRQYQVHAFPLDFPDGIRWQFASEKCLRGYDPEHPTEALFDWYALSGGQLKYYPRASTAKFRTDVFGVRHPQKQMTIVDKAKIYFPEQWTDES